MRPPTQIKVQTGTASDASCEQQIPASDSNFVVLKPSSDCWISLQTVVLPARRTRGVIFKRRARSPLATPRPALPSRHGRHNGYGSHAFVGKAWTVRSCSIWLQLLASY